MSTHNICFHREIRKKKDTFWLKKAPCQKLYNKAKIFSDTSRADNSKTGKVRVAVLGHNL